MPRPELPRTCRHSTCAAALLALALCTGTLPAQAHGDPSRDLSAASGLSLSVPVAVLVAAPSAVLATAGMFTVVAVQASAEGTVWVLERASDGARVSLLFSGEVVEAVAVTAGASVVTTAVAAGWVLSAAGEAIAFVPNEMGRALLHNERVTR